ncbi:hypothetical protein Pla163_02760 [Planctomycetes bacterium Pla163]|uniref:Uncharacterized protein n=2 Tax=Rohdeia mirabilis TaxID=2528008 RepID=A0A518CVD6_9BACT|nr:hypothetical protein Pla163_02760 [Planctomycetes bacterium Pla163]
MEQVRDLLVPYVPPERSRYRFRHVDECMKKGVAPTTVVFELAERDVLGMKPRVRRRLRERCLVFDPQRVWMRSLARAVFHGTAEGRQEPDDEWLEWVLSRSLRDLLYEDRENQTNLVPIPEGAEDDYALMTELLGIPADDARLAAVRFNDMAYDRRVIAFRTIVEGWSLDQCVEAGFGDHAHVQSELRAALAHISNTTDPLNPRIVGDDGEFL